MSVLEKMHYKDEKENLDYTIAYLRSYIERLTGEKIDIDKNVSYSLKHFNSDNSEQFTDLVLNTERQSYLELVLKNGTRSLLQPYFARVDFTSKDDGAKKYYIGKMGLIRDEDNVPLIIDWRAPVSTLYYEERIGKASYTCPDGVIDGEITLKRQYDIKDGQLNDFFDIDITANDEFLQAALGESKDNRLKDIVTTIQAEQNRIIRANMNKPLIVQGAAGGGKTTIALHRIAYLLYNYEKSISAKNFMILAPNRFFLSYISDVLPDLGVENVNQTTFYDFATLVIEEQIKVKPDNSKLAYMLANPEMAEPLKLISYIKSSMYYKRIISRYIDYLTAEVILPKEDFELEGHILFERQRIKHLFCDYYHYLPLSKRILEIRKYLHSALKNKKGSIFERIENDYDVKRERIKRHMEDCPERRQKIITLLDERDELLKTLVKKSKTILRRYIEKFKLKTATEYYRNLFNDAELFRQMTKGLISENHCQAVRRHTVAIIKSGSFETEDLAPLMLIKNMLYGSDFEIKHVVVDEAQDVSLFQFSVLKDILNTTSFTILGDISQGIYSYKGISDWTDIEKHILKGADLATLQQSYRTTVEIMDTANNVIDALSLNVPKAKPVIRHGSAVEFKAFMSLEQTAEAVANKVASYRNSGYKSIAVICKTKEETQVMAELLKPLEFNVITDNEEEFRSGTAVIPSYLAKGLEFDGVIIANASNEVYKNCDTDIKLLYVAATRALHELTVYGVGEISELILPTGQRLERLALS